MLFVTMHKSKRKLLQISSPMYPVVIKTRMANSIHAKILYLIDLKGLMFKDVEIGLDTTNARRKGICSGQPTLFDFG